MKVLDRYILRESIKKFILILLSLTGIYMTVDFFERIRMFLSNDATAAQVVSYFLYEIPMIVSLLLPVSVLLGTLITFSTLSKNSEITALRASGVSLYRISFPVLLLAAGISLFSFFLSEYITPATNQRAKHIEYVEVQKRGRKLTVFGQNEIWYRGRDGIYHFRHFDPDTLMLKGITIHYINPWDGNVSRRVDAERAEWNGKEWTFHDLLVATFPLGDFPNLEKKSTMTADLPETPEDFMVVQKEADEMGYGELKKFIGKIQSEGYDATRYRADLYGKAAFPFVSLILAVMGISFSLLRSERSGGISMAITVGVLIGFSYWIVFAVALSLGRSGAWPPLISAWLANILFGGAAAIMFLKVRT